MHVHMSGFRGVPDFRVEFRGFRQVILALLGTPLRQVYLYFWDIVFEFLRLLYLYCGLCICIGVMYLYQPDIFVSV